MTTSIEQQDKYLPENSEETAAVQLHRRRQGIQSTKTNTELSEPELPGQGEIMKNREQRVGICIVSRDDIILDLNGMISTDQTKISNRITAWKQIYHGVI